MPGFLNRIICICTDARKAALNTYIHNNIDTNGGDWLTNRLSATGNAPATHWWFCAALTNAQAILALNRWYIVASMTPPDWSTMTRAQIRAQIATDRAALIAASGIGMWHADNDGVWDDPVAVLAARGLKVING